MHILALSAGEGFQPEAWRRVLRSGIDAFMVREKHLEARPLLDLVRRTQDLAPELPLWVNGRLDVALAAGCGLHAPEAYPEASLPGLPLSRPLHAPIQWSLRAGADQLLIAPVLPVPGKGPAWGIPTFHAFLDTLPPGGPRLLALGGIHPGTAHLLAHPRLGGVALLRGLWQSADPAGFVARLRTP